MEGLPPKNKMEGQKWEDLEIDCLVNILGRVGMESLLLDVPFVCKSWYQANLNPSCWGRIVFPDIVNELWHDDSFMGRLMDRYGIKIFSITAFIKSIVNRSCKSATMLILPRSCTKEALKYVADECPALRILDLCSELCFKQKVIIPELIGKWKNLEVLVLGISYNLKEILAQISLHCKNFKNLHIDNALINKEEASAIVTFVPSIKQVLLRGAFIYRENLVTILLGCKELVRLDVSNCVGFEADDKILELASHIHTFKYEGLRLYDSDSDFDDYDYDYFFWGKLYDYDDVHLI